MAQGSGFRTPQLEIRYSANPNAASLDVLFHRARLVIAPEWLLAVKDYLATTNTIELNDKSQPKPVALAGEQSPQMSRAGSSSPDTSNIKGVESLHPKVPKEACLEMFKRFLIGLEFLSLGMIEFGCSGHPCVMSRSNSKSSFFLPHNAYLWLIMRVLKYILLLARALNLEIMDEHSLCL
jgi:hypothetical protein